MCVRSCDLSLNIASMPLVSSQLSELYCSYVLSFLIPSCLTRFLFCFHILPTLKHPLLHVMLCLIIFENSIQCTLIIFTLHTLQISTLLYLPIYTTLNFLPPSDWPIKSSFCGQTILEVKDVMEYIQLAWGQVN